MKTSKRPEAMTEEIVSTPPEATIPKGSSSPKATPPEAAVSRGGPSPKPMNLSELKRESIGELNQTAKQFNIENASSLRRLYLTSLNERYGSNSVI